MHCSKSAESAREPLITPRNPDSCTSGLAASGWPARTHRHTHAHANADVEANINIHQYTKTARMPECVMSWLIMHALCSQSSVDEPHWNVLDIFRTPPPPYTHTNTHTHTQTHTLILTSTVLFRLWFTGHFTPSWGGHLQRWPCTVPRGRVQAQHFGSASPRIPKHSFLRCQSPLMKVLLYCLEGLKCTPPFI